MQPSQNLFQLAKVIFADPSAMTKAQMAETTGAFKRDFKKLEKQIEGLLDRVADAASSSVVQAYERHIAELEREKAVLDERIVAATE
ncbi:MAG: hypothetical protein AAFU55_01705 [Pseudomonadota bacterium]